MRVSKKQAAVALGLRDDAMKVIQRLLPDLPSGAVHLYCPRRGFEVTYKPGRCPDYRHWLLVGDPQVVMSVWWNERGDASVPFLFPGEWQAALRAEADWEWDAGIMERNANDALAL